MRDSILFLIALLIAGFAAPTIRSYSGNQMDEDNRRRAAELWEKAVAAKGGRERLHQVRTLVISSTNPSRRGERTKFAGLHKRTEQVYALPDKYWWWDDSRPGVFGLSAEMYNGEEYWLVRDGDPESPQKVPLTELSLETRRFFLRRAQAYFLLETAWFQPVPVGVKSGWVGLKRVDIVHARIGEGKLVFYLDRKTHLPVMAALLSPRADENDPEWIDLYAARFDDYHEVDGVQMPRKVGWGPRGFDNYRFLINVDVDAQIFEQPPRLEDGPEAWKPRQTSTLKNPGARK